MDIQETGQTLAEARKAGEKLAKYPGARPANLARAFSVQEAMIAAMGRDIVGWKVGLTSEKAQEICGYGAPLAGPVFAGDSHEDGVVLPVLAGDLGILEAEIGLRMATDLPPRATPYTRDEVISAIGTVLPMIEWVNKRLPGGLREDAEWIVADGVMNRCVICGSERPFHAGLDLAQTSVQAEVDGQSVTEGVGANAMGGPLEVLTWLAGDLNARGRGLKAGEVISTGLVCDVIQAVPGTQVSAAVAGIGTVTLTIV
ncbi:fumarylacetoacetate hydrolase family protein [Alisedimentitalea sp. MJ-SS2]|uniref:2-keto-4-pentenoate hydratase n=1 Tax=Aliisedimentitalea sp. MJ-SS2 TaxID=3049795 RepID=UPI00290A30D6|nr:fumarylacetoacetate hydrolase family protein [Alisedimentitalea sp. MJ-SS2]MDU8928692.1 fumarylacetoacetate hydrolase family protein [Alisedimentitalea sp. MJ-SS2]